MRGVTLEQLHALLASISDARPGAAVHIYEIRPGWFFLSARSRSLAARQVRALTALRALGWPTFVAGDLDDPREAQLPGAWVEFWPHTWLVPPEPAAEALLARWLHVGGYRLYLAHEPVNASALPDLFRAPPRECVDACSGIGVVALLDSFLDDREWRVLVQRIARAESLAA